MDTLTIEIIAALTAPFPIEAVAVKPGAVRTEDASALALPYADWRVYADRLDTVVGSTNWSIQLIPWDATRLIARLTILGVTKDASGEGDPHDENCGTVAEAQAKKRACAEFGLGRFFYALPQVWVRGQGSRNSFRFNDPQALIFQIYQQAGLLLPRSVPIAPQVETLPATMPTIQSPLPRQGNGHVPIAPNPDRMATARTALAQAEQRTSATSARIDGPPASEKQRGAISALIARCAELGVNPNHVDRLGNAHDIPRLSGIRRAMNLPTGLTKPAASTLIGELDKLVKAAQG